MATTNKLNGTGEYDDITAFHYASYRPPLHSVILKRYLGNNQYNSGLDIGSGTGQSSIALTNYCAEVVGIEPSAAMLSKAIDHPKVTYSLFDKDRIGFDQHTFDIITMAGSLWYGKSQQLLDEIIRVAQKRAIVVIYDFEVLLKTTLSQLGYSPKKSDNAYNHLEDFSGLNTQKIECIEKSTDRVFIQIGTRDLAHLILSVKDWYSSLTELHGEQGLYESITQKLSADSGSAFHDTQVDTFFTLYRLK